MNNDGLTVNVNVETSSCRDRLYLAVGTAACNIHVSDCHWFRLNESPTNIILFPLNLSRKARALNLQITNSNDYQLIPINMLYQLQQAAYCIRHVNTFPQQR